MTDEKKQGRVDRTPPIPRTAANQQPSMASEPQTQTQTRGTPSPSGRAGNCGDSDRAADEVGAPADLSDSSTRRMRSTRRGFWATLLGSPMAVGFTGLAISCTVWLLGLARFMFPNVLIEAPVRFKVGFPNAYPPGHVETKYKLRFGVWIVHGQYEGQTEIYALKAECTHLGCIPIWAETEQKFKCPCHGSGFYMDGINFEGPAPRPLERFAIHVAEDGQLEVDKSRKFHQELGQWSDSACYVRV